MVNYKKRICYCVQAKNSQLNPKIYYFVTIYVSELLIIQFVALSEFYKMKKKTYGYFFLCDKLAIFVESTDKRIYLHD